MDKEKRNASKLFDFYGTLVIHVQNDPPIHEIKVIASNHKIAILRVMAGSAVKGKLQMPFTKSVVRPS